VAYFEALEVAEYRGSRIPANDEGEGRGDGVLGTAMDTTNLTMEVMETKTPCSHVNLGSPGVGASGSSVRVPLGRTRAGALSKETPQAGRSTLGWTSLPVRDLYAGQDQGPEYRRGARRGKNGNTSAPPLPNVGATGSSAQLPHVDSTKSISRCVQRMIVHWTNDSQGVHRRLMAPFPGYSNDAGEKQPKEGAH
jgi:hypothetical protein